MQQFEYSNIGATELILSNGMRVCYKCTDFLDDQVNFFNGKSIFLKAHVIKVLLKAL